MTKTTEHWLSAIFLLVAVFLPQTNKAQIFESKTGVDTLSLAERISLRTNAIDWTLLTPNLGIEFDVTSTNWNRWAVGLSFKSKWNTPATFKNRIFYNITEVRADFRNYWRTRQIDGDGVKAHTGFIDRLFSCRRRVVKHPKTTYYRGAYVSFSDFSVKLGAKGRQGKAVSAGITYGIIKPLYTFKTGNSLDLDFGFDAGFIATNAEEFKLDRAENCYVRTKAGAWKFVPFPMPTSARVGFVYRFGKYPITKKYRWRYDADADYKYRMDTIASNAIARAYNQQIRDSIQNRILGEFWQTYDSAAVVNAKIAAARKVELENRRLEADKQRAIAEQQEKERQRAEKAAAKEAEKAKKEDTPADSTAESPAATEQPAAPAEQPTATEQPAVPAEQPAAAEQPTDNVATEPSVPVEEGEQPSSTEQPAAADSEQSAAPAEEGEQPSSTEQPAAADSEQSAALAEETEQSAPAKDEKENSEDGGTTSTDNNETMNNNSENETEATEGKEAADE